MALYHSFRDPCPDRLYHACRAFNDGFSSTLHIPTSHLQCFEFGAQVGLLRPRADQAADDCLWRDMVEDVTMRGRKRRSHPGGKKKVRVKKQKTQVDKVTSTDDDLAVSDDQPSDAAQTPDEKQVVVAEKKKRKARKKPQVKKSLSTTTLAGQEVNRLTVSDDALHPPEYQLLPTTQEFEEMQHRAADHSMPSLLMD